MTRTARSLSLTLAAVGFASCSFIVAGDFSPCKNDDGCKPNQVCLKSRSDPSPTGPSYCIDMLDACRRESGAFDDPNRIPLAAALPLSSGGLPDAGGTFDDSELGSLNAFKLALDEVNVRGIDGRKFALYVCNTGREKPRIAEQVKWFAEELGAKAVLFSGSSQGIAAHDEAKVHDVMLMSATATSPELINQFQTSGLLWRTAPPDSLQGRVLADFIKADPAFAGITKISVVYVDDSYGQGLKSVVQNLLLAPYTVRTIPYVEGDDLNPVVNALALQAPQLVVLVAFPTEAIEILRLSELKSNLNAASGLKWMFTDSAKDPTILSGGALPQVQNSFGFAPAQGAGVAYPAFRDSFQLKFGVDPATYSFLSHSYDAMYVVALAHAYALGAGGEFNGHTLAKGIGLLSSGTSFTLEPTNLSGMLNAMKAGTSINIDGASGKLDFNLDAGAPGSPIERWQVMPDGGFETRDLTEPPLAL